MPDGIALLEIHGLTPALVALDRLEKAARVRLLQMELNDFYGVFLKIAGDSASLRAAVAEARTTIELDARPDHRDDSRPPRRRSSQGNRQQARVSPLLEAPTVFNPHDSTDTQSKTTTASKTKSKTMDQPSAIGLIETQGFTAVMEAIDTACKAANVEVVGKEKLGGGYITVIVRGDVAAVKAAIDAGRTKVEGLGKLIAAHVIPRPSQSVLSLLPK